MYLGLQILRAKIIGFQTVGISYKKRIGKTSGDERHKLWCQKRAIGCYNREHLIAYGLLRGIPYERIEKCAEQNRPNAEKVYLLIEQHGDHKAKKEFTLQKVKSLLSPTSPPKAQEKIGVK
jgi:hypothetical protein